MTTVRAVDIRDNKLCNHRYLAMKIYTIGLSSLRFIACLQSPVANSRKCILDEIRVTFRVLNGLIRIINTNILRSSVVA